MTVSQNCIFYCSAKIVIASTLILFGRYGKIGRVWFLQNDVRDFEAEKMQAVFSRDILIDVFLVTRIGVFVVGNVSFEQFH